MDLLFITPRRTPLGITLLTVLALGLGALPAWAQEDETNVETSEETHADWRVRCEKPEDGSAPERCFMFQNLVMRDSQRQLLNFAVAFPNEDADTPTAVVMVPLGVSLPAGLGLAVTEDTEPTRVAFQHCITIGCRAVIPLDDGQVAALKAGTEATVSFSDGTGRAVNVPVSLSGFTAAFNSLEAKR
ncbi:MAG: invasion associated locus B family protein [Gammaproteobacteria bacterium]|nr:invasion associated locus B family protein [Gammaproteobacteria bacterium]